jgi:hypothetical protein
MLKECGWINVAKNESQILLLNLVLTPALLHCTAFGSKFECSLALFGYTCCDGLALCCRKYECKRQESAT